MLYSCFNVESNKKFQNYKIFFRYFFFFFRWCTIVSKNTVLPLLFSNQNIVFKYFCILSFEGQTTFLSAIFDKNFFQENKCRPKYNRKFQSSRRVPCQGWQSARCRSSRPEVFCKKGVIRNFPKFTGKYLCRSLFFNKVAVWAWCFLVNFTKFSRTLFSYSTPLVAAWRRLQA